LLEVETINMIGLSTLQNRCGKL